MSTGDDDSNRDQRGPSLQSATAHRTWRISLPRWVVGALVYGPDIRVDGARYAAGPVEGAFCLPAPAPSGYVWIYLAEGTDFCDAPDLVVVMRGYETPHRWSEHLRFRARRDLFELLPDEDRVWPVRDVSLAPDVAFEVPEYPTQAVNRAFRDWCEQVGRDLLLLGGLGPSGGEGLLYAGPISHPLTWDTPCPPRPRKTFDRDTQ